MQNAKSGCLVCGAAVTGRTAPPFAFCGGCSDSWKRSYERVRWATYADHRSSTALADFVRRIRAEMLNGGGL